MFRLLLALYLVLSPLEVRVNWSESDFKDAIAVNLRGQEDTLKQCFKSALEMRYRYEMKLCKRRRLWWDSCKGDTKTEVRSARYDPISETYELISDRFGDTENPAQSKVSDQREAVSFLRNLSSLPLEYLGLSESERQDLGRWYVMLRVLSSCKGEYNETFERFSYFLSLGLVRTSGYDSGWISFELDR